MKRKNKIVIIGGVFITSLIFLSLWYKSPAKIENLNRMGYCACGYSKVEFKNGKIYMVKFFHDSVKPGECIGEYTVQDSNVDLVIFFDKKKYTIRCVMDNIGLRIINPEEFGLIYQAYNDKSYKMYVYGMLRGIGL
jgi:hypothetical protein